VLVVVFGIYAIGEGVFMLIAAFNKRYAQHWQITLLIGLSGLAAGIVALVWPGLTAVLLLAIIAAWALLTGILEIVGALRLREEITGEWSLILSGIISLIFAVLLMTNPAAGALAMVWMIGIYAIICGVLMMILGVRVHRVLRV
jgi:uncharacterized membrane protein HdeD (DUF308 family)